MLFVCLQTHHRQLWGFFSKIHSATHFKVSSSFFVFALCLVLLPPQDNSHSHGEFFVLEKESHSLPTQ